MPCSVCKKTGHNIKTCKTDMKEFIRTIANGPKVLENLIIDYKYQLDHSKKYKKSLSLIKNSKKIKRWRQNISSYIFIMMFNNYL